MKKQKHSTAIGPILLLASLCLFSQSSFAGAKNACQNVAQVKDEVSTSTCFQFVSGFLEGALLSDQQIMNNLGSSTELSDFAKRAMRTRLGKQPEKISATLLADFCLPEDKVTNEVVFRVLDKLKNVEDKNRITSAMIYSIIKDDFPCA